MSGKERLSASVDAGLVAVAQEAVARGQAESVSAWVNDALRLKADHDRRLGALDDFLAAYEAEHGQVTERRCVTLAAVPGAVRSSCAVTRRSGARARVAVGARPDAGAGCRGVRGSGTRGS